MNSEGRLISSNARVGVIGGGKFHRHLSIPAAEGVVAALRRLGYQFAELLDTGASDFVAQLKKVDVAVNAQFGMYGDDGALHGALATLGIPYAGSGLLASAISTNKVMAKRLFGGAGLPTPSFCSFDPNLHTADAASHIAAELAFPLVTKPVLMGGAYGVLLAQNFGELVENLDRTRQYEPLFAESFVMGQELTVTILADRGGRPEALPVLELSYPSECGEPPWSPRGDTAYPGANHADCRGSC
jgi:D-alanine-D-alanine ligase